jgi:hypothetical protein
MFAGWRKLAAWALVYGLVVLSTWKQFDVQPNAKDLLIWVSSAFFVTNAAKPAANGVFEKYRKDGGAK